MSWLLGLIAVCWTCLVAYLLGLCLILFPFVVYVCLGGWLLRVGVVSVVALSSFCVNSVAFVVSLVAVWFGLLYCLAFWLLRLWLFSVVCAWRLCLFVVIVLGGFCGVMCLDLFRAKFLCLLLVVGLVL